ncbi:YaeQ family protein [uncultured Mycolicibacterium sp.]|uniref:YaeQ family protein n=1 Tax=uncultured Mycolicibacterium sp. TaxID=2320817 RepID=UPI0026019CE7|nr:YaeQ family protein [uncultured Mycolicibacterium sp.]
MALSATVFKVDLGIADVDHGYYADHPLTVARHPSETDERMVVRLLAFALRAHRLAELDAQLGFGPGLSTPDAPDLRLADRTGRVLEWIDVGLSDARALGRASGRAERVVLFPFAAGTPAWWRTVGPKVAGLSNLSVLQIPHPPVRRLAGAVGRRMTARVLVLADEVTVTLGDVEVAFTPERLR